MGERSYEVGHTYVRFSEMDEEFRCLCTFPFNDGEELDIERIKALALLGAATVLILSGELDGPVYIPDNLPRWIVDAVRRIRAGATDALTEEVDGV